VTSETIDSAPISRPCSYQRRELGPVAAAEVHLGGLRRTCLRALEQPPRRRSPPFGGGVARVRRPHQVLGRRREQVGEPPVGERRLAARVDHPDPLLRGLDDAAVLELAFAQCVDRTPALAANGGITHAAFDRRDQAREPTFDQEVLCSALQGGDRRLFTDGARDDDHGDLEVRFFDDRQRVERGEHRHRVVGDDHIPRLLVERRPKEIGRIDALRDQVIAGAAQLSREQLRVVIGVFDHQDAQLLLHQCPPRSRVAKRGLAGSVQ
jgi:hypothetical protein